METCRKIRNIIRSKHVKGLVVGYPLDENGEPTRHCQYIQEFLGHLSFDGQLRTPVTLVNEYGSSMEAKALIARRVNTLGLIQINGQAVNELQAIGETNNSVPTVGILRTEQMLDPSVMLRKGIYDKVAAKVVL